MNLFFKGSHHLHFSADFVSHRLQTTPQLAGKPTYLTSLVEMNWRERYGSTIKITRGLQISSLTQQFLLSKTPKSYWTFRVGESDGWTRWSRRTFLDPMFTGMGTS
jgi:hypothetical protein